MSYSLAANGEALELTGDADLVASGGGNDGQLEGNAGNDTLDAGSGNVYMFGGTTATTPSLPAAATTHFWAGSGVNTYVFDQGFGQDEISGIQAADSIVFGSGIAPNNLSVTATVGSDGLLDFAIDEGGGSIVIDGGPTMMSSVNIDFADGSSTTLRQLLAARGSALSPPSTDPTAT